MLLSQPVPCWYWYMGVIPLKCGALHFFWLNFKRFLLATSSSLLSSLWIEEQLFWCVVHVRHLLPHIQGCTHIRCLETQEMLSLLPAFTPVICLNEAEKLLLKGLNLPYLQTQTVYIMIINALSWEESNQGHTSGKGRNCSACGIVLFSNLTVSCRKEWQDQLFSLWKVCVCI